jgi:type 2A phosphatase activator TIP41
MSHSTPLAFVDSMVNQEHITDVVKPYDWTYSTKYSGTNASVSDSMQFEVTTEEAIDIEQLKRPDPILFYDENILFEDELADNGTAVLTTKVVKRSEI